MLQCSVEMLANRISLEILRRARLKKLVLERGRLSSESFKYIHVYLLWRSYLQHVSVLSHEVFSLSIFIQSAIFCAVPLYNFSVFFPPFQSFPLPVLFHLVPRCGAKLINASKMLQQKKGRVCLLNACNTFLLFAGQSIFHPIYCVSIRLFQSSGYLGDFAF